MLILIPDYLLHILDTRFLRKFGRDYRNALKFKIVIKNSRLLKLQNTQDKAKSLTHIMKQKYEGNWFDHLVEMSSDLWKSRKTSVQS